MLAHQLTYGSTFSCVEYSTENNYAVLSLKKKKKELVIVDNQQYQNFELLAEGIKSKPHVFLIINHEKVLTKNVDVTHIAKESTVKAAFPNISLKEFCYDVLDTGTSSLVSICRKEEIEKIVREFESKEISVIGFSLGNTKFGELLPFLNDFDFHTSNGVFEVSNHQILDWKKQKTSLKNYEINGLNVKTYEVLPLAGVLSYFHGFKAKEEPVQTQLVDTFRQKRIFQLGLRFGLGILFASLLLNFFFFSSYSEEVSTLRDELIISEAYRKQLLSLNDIVSKKKQLLESMDAASNSKVTWYFDKLAYSVPYTISLDKIVYQP